jgi:hypothetical protein
MEQSTRFLSCPEAAADGATLIAGVSQVAWELHQLEHLLQMCSH